MSSEDGKSAMHRMAERHLAIAERALIIKDEQLRHSLEQREFLRKRLFHYKSRLREMRRNGDG